LNEGVLRVLLEQYLDFSARAGGFGCVLQQVDAGSAEAVADTGDDKRRWCDNVQLNAVMFECGFDEADGFSEELGKIEPGEHTGSSLIKREESADFGFEELELSVEDFERAVCGSTAAGLVDLECE
jgi:hypothetical protein